MSAMAYLVDMNDLSGFNHAYGETISDPKPARVTVEISTIAVGASIELQVTVVQNTP